MSIYTFYPRRADGAANAFDAVELADDEVARTFALKVLAQHASAVEVAIWLGDREVGRIVRSAMQVADQVP